MVLTLINSKKINLLDESLLCGWPCVSIKKKKKKHKKKKKQKKKKQTNKQTKKRCVTFCDNKTENKFVTVLPSIEL